MPLSQHFITMFFLKSLKHQSRNKIHIHRSPSCSARGSVASLQHHDTGSLPALAQRDRSSVAAAVTLVTTTAQMWSWPRNSICHRAAKKRLINFLNIRIHRNYPEHSKKQVTGTNKFAYMVVAIVKTEGVKIVMEMG